MTDLKSFETEVLSLLLTCCIPITFFFFNLYSCIPFAYKNTLLLNKHICAIYFEFLWVVMLKDFQHWFRFVLKLEMVIKSS